MRFEEVWAAAGTPHAVFCIDPALIQEVTGGSIINIK
jgi:hypothetical protein